MPGTDLTQHILDAADLLIHAEGPAVVSVRAVAQEAGLSVDDFPDPLSDRDELMFAVLMRQLESLNPVAMPAHEKVYVESASDLITSLHWLYIDAWAERPVLARLWHEDGGGRLVTAEIDRRITVLADGIRSVLIGLELVPADTSAQEVRDIVVVANDLRGRGLAQGDRQHNLLAVDADELAAYVNQLLPPPA